MLRCLKFFEWFFGRVVIVEGRKKVLVLVGDVCEFGIRVFRLGSF